MSTYRARAADQRTAENFDADYGLQCSAHGCPHRWSVDAGAGKLCSWHAWAPTQEWPRITQQRLDALADRAARQQLPKPAPPPMTKAAKVNVLQALRLLLAKPSNATRSDWARAIVARHEAGECISPLVLSMAREVASRAARKERA